MRTEVVNQQNQQLSNQPGLLRRAMRANALFSGLSGLVSLGMARPLAEFTGLETAAVFVGLGIVLILFAVDLWWLAGRERLNPRFGQMAVILDLLWVAGSWAIVLSGWPPLTVAGKWLVALLAELVFVFAVVQAYGLYRLSKER